MESSTCTHTYHDTRLQKWGVKTEETVLPILLGDVPCPTNADISGEITQLPILNYDQKFEMSSGC